jgi:hypothetical protein
MAVGNVSFDDCPLLASSFGCTRRASPRFPPRISEARFASTSFTFMLVWVPDPVCHTTSGKWSSSLPESASSAASMMARAFFSPSAPSSMFTFAAAFFTSTWACTTSSGIVSPGKWK